MTSVKGKIMRALKKIENTCVEFEKIHEEVTLDLTIDRLAQEILENRGKLGKELKGIEKIATYLTDIVSISAFELFNSQYEETL